MFQKLGIVLTLSFSAVAAAERGPAVPDYPVEQVAAHTYVIHGPVGYPSPENQGFMNNPAFVVTPAGVVVVDPGSSVQTGEMVLRQVRRITDRPIAAVLNTHAHGDHWLGNHAIREAEPSVPIYGHPNMIAAIEKGVGHTWADNMLQLTEGATRGTEVVGPNHAVDHGDVLTFGQVDFRFHYAGTAHSTSDVMIEVPTEKAVFLGDNVNNQRIVRMDDGTFAGNIAAIDMALGVPGEVFIPGHGRTGDRSIVQAYRDYLDSLQAEVARFYEEGLSDFEMKPRVAEALARFREWPGFDDELGKHISLSYLEIEAKAFQ